MCLQYWDRPKYDFLYLSVKYKLLINWVALVTFDHISSSNYDQKFLIVKKESKLG